MFIPREGYAFVAVRLLHHELAALAHVADDAVLLAALRESSPWDMLAQLADGSLSAVRIKNEVFSAVYRRRYTADPELRDLCPALFAYINAMHRAGTAPLQAVRPLAADTAYETFMQAARHSCGDLVLMTRVLGVRRL
ncbi:hypothetical protein ACWCQK_39525 [Streptomyces sp. NPDC002306]